MPESLLVTKIQASAYNIIKKIFWHRSQIFKNTFFTEFPRATALAFPETYENLLENVDGTFLEGNIS